MSWRAFLIGLAGVVGLNLLTPYNDYVVGNTYLTGNHFPVGVFFFLLVLALGFNLLVKKLRRVWALRRAELMLIFSMMLVSATVPASGLMRYWFPLTASPSYLSLRADFFWEETVLPKAHPGVLLSKDPHSVAARKFFRGTPMDEPVRVPWREWSRVIATWAPFILLYYGATFLLCGMLRRQWVDNERLMFPVARFPLELAEGSGPEGGLLPSLFRQKAFLVGIGAALLLGFIQLVPVMAGKETGLSLSVPISQFLQDTPLVHMNMKDGRVYPLVIGIAFLVASEISLSLWLFYVLTCVENQVFYSTGVPITGGPWQFIIWQQAGAFLAFTAGMLWAARRHLARVARSAVGMGQGGKDADEPIPYPLGFWGFLFCVGGMVAWYMYFGLRPGIALALVGLVFTLVLVHARLVSQGGVILVGQGWRPPALLHDMTGGTAFSPAAAVLVNAQHAILTADCREMLSPHAMGALRISSVYERHRRLFLPVMMVALVAAMVAAGYSTLRWVYYAEGAQNLANQYAVTWHSQFAYSTAHEMIQNPVGSAEPHYVGLAAGGLLMFALQLLRRLFYWWPVNPLGFLISASWAIRPLYFSFFLAWLIKVSILKFAGGDVLRKARTFFLGVIAGNVGLIGFGTFFSLLTDIRIGYIFLPS